MTGSTLEFTHYNHQDSAYSTRVGVLFRKTLTITAQGIWWKKRFIHFNDVAATGWGGVFHSYSFIPTGTTYYITLQDDRDRYPIQIVTRRKSVYKNIIEHLWERSCSRIIVSMLVGLQHGKRYRFSTAVIDDQGIYLSHKRLFKSPEMFYFTWDNVDLWSSNGQLFIGQRNGIFHALSYQSCDNIHILETIVSEAKQQQHNRLSRLLD